MTNKKFYDFPQQVQFRDGEEIIHGIAYHDEIICACCGSIYELDEVEVTKVLPWVDFTQEIAADDSDIVTELIEQCGVLNCDRTNCSIAEECRKYYEESEK